MTLEWQGCVPIRDNTWLVPSLLLVHSYWKMVTVMMMMMMILVMLTVDQLRGQLIVQGQLPEPRTLVPSVLFSLPDVSCPLIQWWPSQTNPQRRPLTSQKSGEGRAVLLPGNLPGRPCGTLLISCAFTWVAVSREFRVQSARRLTAMRHHLTPIRMATINPPPRK